MYKKFEAKNNIATGFYSSSLRNNGVRELDNKLLLSGDLSLAPSQKLPFTLDVSLTDFIIFKKDAILDEVLSTKSGTIQQTVQDIPLIINYILKSIAGESIPTFTSPDGKVYTDVRTSKIELDLEITTVQMIFGTPQTISILTNQTVLTSNKYIANDIGVVYAKIISTYSVSPLVATQFGIPATNTQTQEEFLDTRN